MELDLPQATERRDARRVGSGSEDAQAHRTPTPTPMSLARSMQRILLAVTLVLPREEGVGPFELVTFEDAYYNKTKIAEVVEQRRMPPWHGRLHPKFGKLANDRRLSERDIKTILHWARGGAAEGGQSVPAI